MAPLVSPREPAEKADGLRSFEFEMTHYPLFKGAPEGTTESWGVFIRKEGGKEEDEKTDDGDNSPSKQGVDTGRKPHPFVFASARRLKLANAYHSTCLAALRDATTGLGFKTDKVADVLDPLCDTSFQDLLDMLCEDYYIGNGYMEVVREQPKQTSPIVGLHFLPSPDVHKYVENDAYDFHYEIETSEGQSTKFAKFGDIDRFMKSKYVADKKRVSEIIHFRFPSILDKHYGIGDFIAAVPYIELQMAMLQHFFDFFKNSGVPDFMLFITGGKVDDDDWTTIKGLLRQHVGLGNHRKSLALNIPGSEIKIVVQQMRVEALEASFRPMLDSLALSTVTSWRVPPLLAGIQIPGKLGANNELPNAIMAFDALVVSQTQLRFKTRLGNTLGNRKMNGGLELRKKHFEFNSIKDRVNLVQMAETGALRTPVGGKDPDAPNTTKKPDQKKRAPGKPKTKVVRNP